MDRDEKFEHLFDDDDEFKAEQGDFHFDDNLKFDEPAEYQFSDDIDTVNAQEDVSSAVATDAKSSLFERLSDMNLKKILIYLAIGVVIALFVFNNAKQWFGGSSTQKTTTVAKSAPALPEEPIVKKAPRSQAGLDLKAINQLKQLTQQNAVLANRVQTLENQMAQTTNQLGVYQNQAAKAASSADAMSKSLASAEQQMMQINNALQTLISAAKQKQQQASIQPSPTSMMPPVRNYVIQAIIPGRAWLKADNGQIITVAVGDAIAGFGNVILIDPEQGLVQTDAGIKMTYPINQG
jgi:hypothetical protein